jgi:ketosteroid isomerase-like protein
MISQTTKGWLLFCGLLILISLSLSSCASYPLTPLPEAEVVELADSCREIYTEQIDAWISADYDRVRDVYTEDVVHFDGGPVFVSVDEVVEMARWMNLFLSDYTQDAGDTYISASDCLGTWLLWGAKGLTEEDPRREFDLIETRDGKISFWRLFYGEKFDFAPINKDLLSQFAETLPTGRSRAMKEIYAEDAVLVDSLFGVEAQGLDEILGYTAGFKKAYSVKGWELLIPFSEVIDSDAAPPDFIPSHGGVYRITSTDDQGDICYVNAVVILTPNQEGKISQQLVYYQADSLIECGWLTE